MCQSKIGTELEAKTVENEKQEEKENEEATKKAKLEETATSQDSDRKDKPEPKDVHKVLETNDCKETDIEKGPSDAEPLTKNETEEQDNEETENEEKEYMECTEIGCLKGDKENEITEEEMSSQHACKLEITNSVDGNREESDCGTINDNTDIPANVDKPENDVADTINADKEEADSTLTEVPTVECINAVKEKETDATVTEDDVTDSQLCAVDWSSQIFTDTVPCLAEKTIQERSLLAPCPSLSHVEGGMEDGTAVVVSLIKELQQLNKSLLKTKREMETIRRQRPH